MFVSEEVARKSRKKRLEKFKQLRLKKSEELIKNYKYEGDN